MGALPEPLVAYRAHQRQAGDVLILHEDDELTGEVGDITHGCWDDEVGLEQKEERVVADIVIFLTHLFEDRVLPWSHTENGETDAGQQGQEGVTNRGGGCLGDRLAPPMLRLAAHAERSADPGDAGWGQA